MGGAGPRFPGGPPGGARRAARVRPVRGRRQRLARVRAGAVDRLGQPEPQPRQQPVRPPRRDRRRQRRRARRAVVIRGRPDRQHHPGHPAGRRRGDVPALALDPLRPRRGDRGRAVDGAPRRGVAGRQPGARPDVRGRQHLRLPRQRPLRAGRRHRRRGRVVRRRGRAARRQQRAATEISRRLPAHPRPGADRLPHHHPARPPRRHPVRRRRAVGGAHPRRAGHRHRCGDRGHPVGLQHDSPGPAGRGMGDRARHLGLRRAGRRGHLDPAGGRPRPRPRLRQRRQPVTRLRRVGAGRHQPVHQRHHRPRPRDRRPALVLPGRAPRPLGLGPRDGAGAVRRDGRRRRDRPGRRRRRQELPLLPVGPRDRRAPAPDGGDGGADRDRRPRRAGLADAGRFPTTRPGCP